MLVSRRFEERIDNYPSFFCTKITSSLMKGRYKIMMSNKNRQVLQKLMYMPALMMNAALTNEECQKIFGEIIVLKLKQASFSNCETKTEKSQFYQPE